MKNILVPVVALTMGYATFALLPAQEPVPVPGGTKTKATKTKAQVQAVSVAAVTGAPYSAIAVTELTQTLGDGNHIVHTQSQKVFRDGQGRERTESVGLTETGRPAAISISDPVAKVSYTLSAENRTAVQKPQIPTYVGPDEVTQYVRRLVASAANIPNGGNYAQQDLGSQAIEGVFANGTRTTMTIPAGQVGNERPILVVDEVWYSPDLKLDVMTRSNDPRSGERVYRLTQIVRAEPDPALFQVPPGYTVSGQGGK